MAMNEVNQMNNKLSHLFAETLETLEDFAETGIAFLPEQPSPAMIRAGALAGGIAEEQAAKIYRAMVAAERLEDRGGAEGQITH